MTALKLGTATVEEVVSGFTLYPACSFRGQGSCRVAVWPDVAMMTMMKTQDALDQGG